MTGQGAKHDIEYFLKPYSTPQSGNSTFKKYSIDYRWFPKNRGNKTYLILQKDKSLKIRLKKAYYQGRYYEGMVKDWTKMKHERFSDSSVHSGIKISKSTYDNLPKKENDRIEPGLTGTIVLGYNFRIMFDLGEGHTVEQVQEHYNRCSANFIKHFENMVELVKNKPNLKIKVSGYASNEYDDDLKNITAKAKASNSKLAENRQTAGMEFLTWYFCLPSESIEGGQSNILSTDLDLNQFNRDRSIHFSVTS